MNKYLFKEFLQNKRIYALNKTYWRNQVAKTAPGRKEALIHNHLQTSFANGQPMQDGNPIYSAFSKPLKRAVRIIQQMPGAKDSPFSAWVKETEFNGQDIQELVIDLQLTPETKAKALQLIHIWFKPDMPTTEAAKQIKETLHSRLYADSL